jgi:lipopolysaccharide transport system ATP-binding protein
MQEITGQGRTILFVSHNMKAITEICSRTILLSGGRVERDGATREVMRSYTGVGRHDSSEAAWVFEKAPGNDAVRLLGVHACRGNHEPTAEFTYEDTISICATFRVLDDRRDLFLNLYLENEDGVFVLMANSVGSDPKFEKGTHRAEYAIPPHLLNEGGYSVRHFLFKERAINTPQNIAHVEYPVTFTVDYTGKFSGGQMSRHPGVVRLDGEWQLSKFGEI